MFGLDSTNPLSRMMAPDDYVFAPGVQTALNSVCGALHATLPARAIADDMDGVAEPITPIGKLHHAWVALSSGFTSAPPSVTPNCSATPGESWLVNSQRLRGFVAEECCAAVVLVEPV